MPAAPTTAATRRSTSGSSSMATPRTIGITDYAQEQLGDIVYVDLPEPGATITQFEKMGEIESVKAVSDLYTPASGEVARRRTRPSSRSRSS